MDWKLFASTFAAIFLAEIGDETQLATLSLAAGGSSRWVVFAGSALALVATSAIAVLGGEALSRVVPPSWLRRGAGVLFIVLGVVFLLGWGEGRRWARCRRSRCRAVPVAAEGLSRRPRRRPSGADGTPPEPASACLPGHACIAPSPMTCSSTAGGPGHCFAVCLE
jgi:hypothetical protein